MRTIREKDPYSLFEVGILVKEGKDLRLQLDAKPAFSFEHAGQQTGDRSRIVEMKPGEFPESSQKTLGGTTMDEKTLLPSDYRHCPLAAGERMGFLEWGDPMLDSHFESQAEGR